MSGRKARTLSKNRAFSMIFMHRRECSDRCFWGETGAVTRTSYALPPSRTRRKIGVLAVLVTTPRATSVLQLDSRARVAAACPDAEEEAAGKWGAAMILLGPASDRGATGRFAPLWSPGALMALEDAQSRLPGHSDGSPQEKDGPKLGSVFSGR
jgi:hypothetical protein